MYYFLQYLKHLVSATNQHGIHSPFVYDYLTKCLYAKTKFKTSKGDHVVLKSIPYFTIKKIKIDAEDASIESKIQHEFKLKPSDKTPFDLIYVDQPAADILSRYKDLVHNDSVIFIKNIHSNKHATHIWETLKASDIISVSIDMFYCGALFFRKEQVKEHFKVRI